MTNHLINETSPYLLQHVDNPVEWYPWGEEALNRAKAEDKPIFLSIGYAACHWCHVMAHESFEDPETAQILNEHFINIKVDREERPDLDSIYMAAVVAMTKQGGWPMSVFLTPDGSPFWGGTYFPPQPRFGMPSFQQVLLSIHHAWQTRRQDFLAGAEEVSQHIRQIAKLQGQTGLLEPSMFDRAFAQLSGRFDRQMGGFGQAPKFPPAMTIEFLLRYYHSTKNKDALYMAEFTLEKMAQGGMYDQVGGGFARYSTDNDWLVPHFEKMLYDNALLSRVYLHAWQVTGKPFYRRIVEETLDWAIKEMRQENGGFYSSLDADSEGEEGKFYVWQLAEIEEVLEELAPLFVDYYGVSARGNWEDTNILHVTRPLAEVADTFNLNEATAQAQLDKARQKLYEVRSKRVWPGLDNKVLTSWNGLMLPALAEAGRVLQRPDYIQVAIDNAEFLYQTMRRSDGRLYRTWKAGADPKYNAYLEDYAYLADGLLALYQTTFDERWFVWAQELTDIVLEHFQDEQLGGFFDTSDDHEQLIHRPKEVQDNVTPSANAMVAHNLLHLSLYTGNGNYWSWAEQMVSSLYGALTQYPMGFAHWLGAGILLVSQPQEIAIVGEVSKADTQALLAVVQQPYRPYQVVTVGLGSEQIPLLHQREQIEGKATAYVCRQFVCQLPVTTVETFKEVLEKNEE